MRTLQLALLIADPAPHFSHYGPLFNGTLMLLIFKSEEDKLPGQVPSKAQKSKICGRRGSMLLDVPDLDSAIGCFPDCVFLYI